ncbi:hypothetical protein SRHO_G00262520 [Serrasalmus rhombeus]
MEPPLHKDFHSTKDIPEASNDLAGILPDQIKAEAEAIKPLMSADLDEEADNNQPLDTEEEASTDSMTAHMEENDTPNDHLLDVEEKSDAESDWMLDYEPIKSWADFMEETEGTIDQSAEIEELKNDVPVNKVKADEQERNTNRETCEKIEADQEENSTRTSGDRGIQVGAVDQWRHQQASGKTTTLSENSGTCERAPDPQQQRRAQRKEDRRESCHWTVKNVLKTLQAPPEEKSAPQRDCRRNGEQTYG